MPGYAQLSSCGTILPCVGRSLVAAGVFNTATAGERDRAICMGGLVTCLPFSPLSLQAVPVIVVLVQRSSEDDGSQGGHGLGSHRGADYGRAAYGPGLARHPSALARSGRVSRRVSPSCTVLDLSRCPITKCWQPLRTLSQGFHHS